MKKGDVIRQKCVNTTFYLTGILAHKVNNKRNSTVAVRCKVKNELPSTYPAICIQLKIG